VKSLDTEQVWQMAFFRLLHLPQMLGEVRPDSIMVEPLDDLRLIDLWGKRSRAQAQREQDRNAWG